MEDWYDLLNQDVQPDMSNIERIEMNAYEDIIVYKDGTKETQYHCCD